MSEEEEDRAIHAVLKLMEGARYPVRNLLSVVNNPSASEPLRKLAARIMEQLVAETTFAEVIQKLKDEARRKLYV